MNNKEQTFTMYTDGNRFPKINKAGFGGYIQNEDGLILVEFTQEILENENKHNFEILGILRGIDIAKDMEIKKLHCKCDDKTLVSHIIECQKNPEHLNNIYGSKKSLIEKCVKNLSSFEKITFEYIPRTLNKYSDVLSRKYVSLIEKNYLVEHQKLLEKSKLAFINKEIPQNSIYYFNDNVYVMPHEHNPFIISQKKNKKQKEFRKEMFLNFENNWSLDIIYKNKAKTISGMKMKEIDYISLRKYDKENNEWCEYQKYYCQKLNLNIAIDIYIKAIKTIGNKENNLWLSTNIESLQDIFYRKKPISREIFPKFLELNKEISIYNKVLFHRLPKEIEINLKNKNIKTETDYKEDKKNTIDLIKNSDNQYKKNKYFGRLLSIVLKEMFDNPKILTNKEKEQIKKDLIKEYSLSLTKKKL